MRLVDVEGGCWVIETAQGRVQPIHLPNAYRKDGLRVKVVLSDAPAMMSACQVGELKKVESIERSE